MSLGPTVTVYNNRQLGLFCWPQAVPAAQELTQGVLQPAAQHAADQAAQNAQNLADEGLHPAAKAVAENVSVLAPTLHQALATLACTWAPWLT